VACLRWVVRFRSWCRRVVGRRRGWLAGRGGAAGRGGTSGAGGRQASDGGGRVVSGWPRQPSMTTLLGPAARSARRAGPSPSSPCRASQRRDAAATVAPGPGGRTGRADWEAGPGGRRDDAGGWRLFIRPFARQLAARVERCCPRARQAHRSDTWSGDLVRGPGTSAGHARCSAAAFRAPDRPAPGRPRPRQASRASGPRPPCAAAPSPSGPTRWRRHGPILPGLLAPPHPVGLQAADLLAPDSLPQTPCPRLLAPNSSRQAPCPRLLAPARAR
jgi:hypothetical protein